VVSGSRVTLRFGAYDLIVEARELWRDGRRVRLAPQAIRVLIQLTSAPDTLVTREDLRAVLWPGDIHVDFEGSLNTAVRKLRAALRDNAEAPRYVQTVPGRGYRFIAPVHRVCHPSAPAAAAAAAAVRTDERHHDSPAMVAVQSAWWRHRQVGRVLRASAILCGAATVAVVIHVWPARSRQIPLIIRSVETDASANDGDRARPDAVVASLQVLAGQLDPARLVVVNESRPWRRACHQLTVSAHEAVSDAETGTGLTVRLLDTCRDEQIWAASGRPEAGRALDASIIKAAGRALADRLLGGERAAREAAATIDGAALEAYRRGQVASRAGRREDLGLAMDGFETALRLDPEFAPAWAALARTRATRAIRDGRDAGELRRADAEAMRALELDRDFADAHVALGQVRFARDRDFVGADVWFQRARALGAVEGRDLLWHACVLYAQGRLEDAMRILDEAIARDPRMAALHAWRGLLLHALHRYDEELVALRHAAALDPQSPEALFHLGLGYARRRQFDLALPAMRRAAALSGDGAYYVSWFGRVAADAGDLAAAEHALHELETIARHRGVSPALSGAVAHHIEARRQQTGGL
jgi:DNA-binding winged helix-turn-helix (wHTH) protein/tetratricopeptide (TPR) repeat protein